MNKKITFKELRETDLPEVKNIYDYYVLNSTTTFHTEPITFDELKEFIYFSHPKYKSFLIFYEGGVCGYCYATYYKKRQAYNRTAEVTIYLKNDFTGKGIGQTALQYLENALKESGIKVLLAVIAGDNNASIRAFEKAGYTGCALFKNVGEKFGRILDVVVCQKEI